MSSQPFIFVVTQNGVPASGLSTQLNKSMIAYNISTLSMTTTNLPTISEFGTSGRYIFNYDASANPPLLITMEAGTEFDNPNERYISISVLSDSSNIENALNAVSNLSQNGVKLAPCTIQDNPLYEEIITSIVIGGHITVNTDGTVATQPIQATDISNITKSVVTALPIKTNSTGQVEVSNLPASYLNTADYYNIAHKTYSLMPLAVSSTGEVQVSNLPSVYITSTDIANIAQAVSASLLATPANKIKTDANGAVEISPSSPITVTLS